MQGKKNPLVQKARPYAPSFIALFLIINATDLIVILFPWFYGRLIDALFYGKDLPLFLRITGIYLVLYVINELLHLVLDMTFISLRTRYLYDVKKAI